MSKQSHDIPETEDPEGETKALGKPLNNFKRPDRQSKAAHNLTAIRFMLPNGESVTVPAGAYLVMGRQEGNDREVNFDLSVLYGAESGISRNHAVLQLTHKAVFVRDLNSRNGTFLNGEELYPMRDYAVNDGDELRLGQVTMRIVFV